MLLRNVLWLDPETLIPQHCHILIEPGPHGALCLLPSDTPLSNTLDTVVDGKGMLATRGFVCGHHHIYSALSRGMPAPPQGNGSFASMLENVWWRLDRRLDSTMIEASALAAAMQAALCGTTFIIDHHSSPHAVPGCLSTIAKAFERVGVGHLLCLEISDRDGPSVAQLGLEESAAWLESGRVGHVGLHASFTVGNELLRDAVQLARTHHTGVHIHVAESAEDQEHCQNVYGKRVLFRLAEAGVLDLPHTILGHAIHLNDEERALLHNSAAWVAQNAESNLNNRVGLGRYADLPHVLLGTDGMHGDMLRAMQALWYAAPGAGLGTSPPLGKDFTPLGEALSPLELYQRLRAAHSLTAAMHAPGDSANNIVLFDYDFPTPIHAQNALSHLLFGLSSRHVHTVIAQGNIIVQNHRLTQIDQDEAFAFTRVQAQRLWTRLES